MSTPYEKIYANLLPKFKSYKIPLMTEEDVKEYLHDYIIPAIAEFHICKKDLTDRDEESECFNCDLSDDEIEILSNFALLEYIDSNYIRVPSLLEVNLTSSDFHAFSPANMLNSLMAMQKTYLEKNETLLSRYAWMSDKKHKPKLGTGYKKNKLF